ncbi:MAG TPA: DUF192 domain-containing protein [Candidatus Paceibacterota bacterium]
MNKNRFVLGAVLFLGVLYYVYALNERTNLHILEINGEKIGVYVALTDEERARGLSGLEALGVDEGMLFIFEEIGIYHFWMKDMLFPIDIIWIDDEFKVSEIIHNVGPETFPQLFRPQRPIRYVLEVNAGFAEDKQLKPGQEVNF